MKTRLNETIRNEIIHDVMEHRFKDQAQALVDELAKLGEDFYDYMLTKEEQKLIKSCPSHWFAQSSYEYLYIGGKALNLNLRKTVLKPEYWHSDQRSNSELSGSSPFGKRMLKYFADKEKLESQRETARQSVLGTLKSFKYLEDLIEAWPEIEAFVPKADAIKAKMTVALVIAPKDLNAMLRLP